MRKSVRIESDEVQGAGSFVVLAPPPWKEAKRFLLGNDEGGDEQTRGLAMMEALLPLCVVEWNWTDGEDTPLPLPATADSLDMREVMWLVPHVSAFLAPAKN